MSDVSNLIIKARAGNEEAIIELIRVICCEEKVKKSKLSNTSDWWDMFHYALSHPKKPELSVACSHSSIPAMVLFIKTCRKTSSNKILINRYLEIINKEPFLQDNIHILRLAIEKASGRLLYCYKLLDLGDVDYLLSYFNTFNYPCGKTESFIQDFAAKCKDKDQLNALVSSLTDDQVWSHCSVYPIKELYLTNKIKYKAKFVKSMHHYLGYVNSTENEQNIAKLLEGVELMSYDTELCKCIRYAQEYVYRGQKIKSLALQLAELMSSNEEAKQKKDLETQLKFHKGALKLAKCAIEGHGNEITELKTELAKQKEEFEKCSQSKSQVQKELETMTDELKLKENQHNQTLKELEIYMVRNAELKKQIENLEKEKEKEEKEKEEKEKEEKEKEEKEKEEKEKEEENTCLNCDYLSDKIMINEQKYDDLHSEYFKKEKECEKLQSQVGKCKKCQKCKELKNIISEQKELIKEQAQLTQQILNNIENE